MLCIFSCVEHKPEISIGITAETSTPVAMLNGSAPSPLFSGSQLSPIAETSKNDAQIGYTPRSAGMTIVWLLNKIQN